MMRNHNNDYFTILKQWKGWKVNLGNGTLFIAWGGERGGFGSYQTKINPIPPKAP